MLLKLLYIEWLKTKNYNVFRVLLTLFTVFFAIILIFVSDNFKNFPPMFPTKETATQFPTIWDYQGYVGSWLVSTLLGFLVINLITSEVSNKTMRQNIITGYSRKEFFVAKLLMVLSVSIWATLVYVVSTICIGLYYTEGTDIGLIFDNNWAIARFFFQTFCTLLFAFFIAFLIRKGSLSIIVYFMYSLILEPIIRAIQLGISPNEAVKYWPLNSFEDLMPNPLFRIPSFTSKDYSFDILLSYQNAALLSLGFTLIFVSLAWWSFHKRNI